MEKYGSWFSYEGAPRAQIFKRDHSKVKNIQSMIELMRFVCRIFLQLFKLCGWGQRLQLSCFPGSSPEDPPELPVAFKNLIFFQLTKILYKKTHSCMTMPIRMDTGLGLVFMASITLILNLHN